MPGVGMCQRVRLCGLTDTYEKSGQANVAVIKFGEGESTKLSIDDANTIASDVLKTPGHSINRVIVVKGGVVIVDLP